MNAGLARYAATALVAALILAGCANEEGVVQQSSPRPSAAPSTLAAELTEPLQFDCRGYLGVASVSDGPEKLTDRPDIPRTAEAALREFLERRRSGTHQDAAYFRPERFAPFGPAVARSASFAGFRDDGSLFAAVGFTQKGTSGGWYDGGFQGCAVTPDPDQGQ